MIKSIPAYGKVTFLFKHKQNVPAALRVLQEQVRTCMAKWNNQESQSNRIYLKMGSFMLEAFTNPNPSVKK